jgi:TolB-like protein/Tfp pilus assembly protein PilF
VLPFANSSDDKDANAFFADGIHEDILTNLSNIRELRVVSRTSVMGYRGTTKKIPEIARELGVAFVLEGSVRRAGNRVRVTGQLIRAATDQHLWARNFDHELTDVFAIQTEVARAIAAELQAALSPHEQSRIAKPPTRNVAAYELVLKARALANESDGPNRNQSQIVPLLRGAVRLDPNYAAAYADLASVLAYVGERRAGAPAREAINHAVRLEPDSPDVIRSLGDYYYYVEDDYVRALEQYAKVAQLRPNDAQLYNRIASVQRRQGRWTESIANFRKGKELDPTFLNNVGGLGYTLLGGRRYGEALDVMRFRAERQPDDVGVGLAVAFVSFLATGSATQAEDFFAQLPTERASTPAALRSRVYWALRSGDLDTAVRLDQQLRRSGETASPSVMSPERARAIDVAAALMVLGRADEARTRIAHLEPELRREIERDEDDHRAWMWLGSVLALLGRQDEALRSARKAVELTPESHDVIYAAGRRAGLAFVRSWTRERGAAIADYAELLRKPWSHMFGDNSALNVHVMKRDPRFHPLRGDPRFEALLNDPKNNQPLF